jgi:hypothetical protein
VIVLLTQQVDLFRIDDLDMVVRLELKGHCQARDEYQRNQGKWGSASTKCLGDHDQSCSAYERTLYP